MIRGRFSGIGPRLHDSFDGGRTNRRRQVLPAVLLIIFFPYLRDKGFCRSCVIGRTRLAFYVLGIFPGKRIHLVALAFEQIASLNRKTPGLVALAF
jgi:hypothetical protein